MCATQRGGRGDSSAQKATHQHLPYLGSRARPTNAALRARAAEIDRLRAAGRPTVPSTLADELGTNPFLRADDPAMAAAVGMAGAEPSAVFAEIRRRKDAF